MIERMEEPHIVIGHSDAFSGKMIAEVLKTHEIGLPIKVYSRMEDLEAHVKAEEHKGKVKLVLLDAGGPRDEMGIEAGRRIGLFNFLERRNTEVLLFSFDSRMIKPAVVKGFGDAYHFDGRDPEKFVEFVKYHLNAT